MKKYRVITRIAEKVINASVVEYDDVFINFFNQSGEIVATFMTSQVIGVVNEVN